MKVIIKDPTMVNPKGTNFGNWVDPSKEYLVYGIGTVGGESGYYLDTRSASWVDFLPANLFNISDSRLSKHWRCKFYPEGCEYEFYDGSTRKLNESMLIIGFEEFVNDVLFREKTIEGEEKEVELFREHMRLLYVENPPEEDVDQ